MSNSEDLKEIVRVFAQYGYRKTSMRDLADGLGISRQALYNRFSSKDEVFGWAADALLDEGRDQCLAALGHDGPVRDRILKAVDAWIGQHVDQMKASPHSAEIVTMVGDVSSAKADETNVAIRNAMADVLAAQKPKQEADALALTIHMAAKGLMSAAKTSDEFNKKLRQIVDALPLD